MSVIQLIISLIVVGVLLWAMNSYIPMSPAIKKIVNIVIVILVVLFILRFFGIFGTGPRIMMIN